MNQASLLAHVRDSQRLLMGCQVSMKRLENAHSERKHDFYNQKVIYLSSRIAAGLIVQPSLHQNVKQNGTLSFKCGCVQRMKESPEQLESHAGISQHMQLQDASLSAVKPAENGI